MSFIYLLKSDIHLSKGIDKPVILFLLFVLFVFTGCQKEKIESREYPRMKTHHVSGITSEGANFHGEMISSGNSPVVAHGFVWASSPIDYARPVTDFEREVFEGGISNGAFSGVVDFGLERGRKYYVSAFAQTDHYTVYGNSVAFESEGSKAHEIALIEPLVGQIGDTVTIYGTRFCTLKSNNQVKFGYRHAAIVDNGKEFMSVIVPDDIESEENISITALGNTVAANEKFKILELQMGEFSPLTATYGDVITLAGQNFSKTKSGNHVYFDDVEAVILEADVDQLKVSVPSNLNVKECTIRVKVGKQEFVYSEKFRLKDYVLNGISKSECTSSDVVSIYGENFNGGNISFHSVKLGERECEILSVSKNEISFVIPYDIAGQECAVSVTLIESTQKLVQKLTIVSPWSQLNDFPGSTSGSGSGFVLNNDYIFFPEYSNNVWSYSPASDAWIKKNDIEGNLYENTTGVGLNDGGLIGLGHSYHYEAQDMYKYDPESDSWSKTSNLPTHQYHQRVTAFSVENDVYVFMGDYYKHFWKYNSDSDTWIELPGCPGPTGHRYYSAGFIIDKVMYFVGGLNGYDWNNYKDVWAFDVKTNTWEQKNDFIGSARHGAVAFELNGKGYYGLGKSSNGMEKDFYEYNPATDTWKRIMDFEGEARYKAIGFTIGDDGYVGIGDTRVYNYRLRDMWKFTPLN